jgi:gliding motility-associated-like protein
MTDYLLRFDFEGQCALDTFYFDPWFFPTPTWIQWDFGDTASGSQNISNDLHATHAFTHGGEFEVSVLLTYPSGRVEKTSRVVEVDSVPYPNLGPDTLICKGSSLALNANCNGQFFTWITGQWGTASITVSDTGYYWVRASYANGCDNFDTIHVGFLPEIQFDETNLTIASTACGGTSGSITGLYALGPMPLAYEWKDLSGTMLGNTTDLYNLGVGQYYLSVTDGNGCTAESPLYTITDAGNLQVDSVTVSGAICGQNNGMLEVHATPQPGGQLLYSIDNGDNFYDNGGLFENLPPEDYVVMIKDLDDCEGVYSYNPVSVADLAAPNINEATTLPEIDFLQNGEIMIDASGSTSDLYYSITNGSSWQTNIGNFTGLSAGIYDCIVRDENNCDTAFQVEVTRFWATILQAIAGSTDTCAGTTFEIPLLVEHFNDVSKFRMHLSYNNDLMECLGYTGAEPSLADSLQVFINEASGDILVTWQDDPPVTLPDQAPVVEIVFTDKVTGQGTIDWYGQAQESYFVKSTADTLAAAFTTGTVRISSPPSISGLSDLTLCEGEELLTIAMVQGSNPIAEQHWTWPDGSAHPGPGLMLFGVEPAQSGAYTFMATDSRGCTSEESLQLTIIPTPNPALPNGDTLTLDPGQSLDAGSGFSSYSWNTCETAQEIIPAAEGWYKVTVTSTNNCQAIDSVYVTFREEPLIEPSKYFYIPNAFTPDGDGRNDVFMTFPNNNNISHFSIGVFDRWGGQIFESEDIGKGWDGTKNGEPCPGGVYVYRLTFRVEGVAEEQVMAGTVAVVR